MPRVLPSKAELFVRSAWSSMPELRQVNQVNEKLSWSTKPAWRLPSLFASAQAESEFSLHSDSRRRTSGCGDYRRIVDISRWRSRYHSRAR